MKNIFKSFAGAAVVAFGMAAGSAAFTKLTNPVVRARIKRKCVRIKDAIFSKEES